MKPNRTVAVSGGVLLLASAALAGTLSTIPANASTANRGSTASALSTRSADDTAARRGGARHTHTRLRALNNSSVVGRAHVRVKHRRLKVSVDAHGLTKGQPHAQHIHFGATARHECPTSADNTNGDFRLSTAEGLPAYGPIAVSLTTRGDTSPASALAVTRFPTAPRGVEHYDRRTRTSLAVARAIKRGKAVVVVHGVDYNKNGKYDFASAGASELDPSLPAEATDPAACGVLKR
jgi:hypothetical protein